MDKYIDINVKVLKERYFELGKIKNMCSCKKNIIKNYDEKLSILWLNCWETIHNFALCLPYELEKCSKIEVSNVYDFFNKKVAKIPCRTCAKHYREYLNSNPTNYPQGSQDQDIFRFLEPKFYPRLKVDYKNKMAYRS